VNAIDVEAAGDVHRRLQSVRGPKPVLDRRREAALTQRQRELLDELEAVFRDGFSHLTMADIAARAKCSLRTLYALASSREHLVLLVVDRQLWRIGRSAFEAIEPGMAPLDALRAYLEAAWMAVSETTEAWVTDLDAVPGARALSEGHNRYLYAITRMLLDVAVQQGDVADTNTAAVAHVMAGLGRDLARPDIIPTLGTTPKRAADEVLDVMLRGLLSR
jgi:AcrR family transcriptional regulator